MSDTRTNRNESVIPRMPSNRRFIEQMLAWGWIMKRTGRYVTMQAPIGKETVEVQAANKHDANATSTFLQVYKLTCSGDADLFWRGPSDLWLEMLAEQREANKRKKEAAMAPPAPLDRPGQQAVATTPAPVVATSVAPAAPPVAEPTKGRPGYFTGQKYSSVKTVMAVLLATPNRSLDAEAICKKLGLDPDIREERRSVSNTLSLLYKNGQVRRVSAGKYRPVVGELPPSPPAPVAAARPAPVPAPTVIVNNFTPPPTIKPVEESVDDVIEAVLDLLLPNGFKAQDLRVIQPWIEATKKMVGTVAK